MITYRLGNNVDLDAFIDVYRNCSLGVRRPIDDRSRMQTMLVHANLMVTAWDNERMIGVARSLSDFTFCTYLSDLAVRDSHQRLGIGRTLMQKTQEAAPSARLILLSAPAAVEYYPRVGFTRHESAWSLAPGEQLR
jgi:predicted N-acetyltransferase YhbS